MTEIEKIKKSMYKVDNHKIEALEVALRIIEMYE